MKSSRLGPRLYAELGRCGVAFAAAAAVLLWGFAAVADSSVTFPVTTPGPGGTVVGNVTVKVTDDPGPPQNKGITGGFTSTVPQPPPPGTEPSISGALQALGEDHFNWFQVVVKDEPPAGRPPGQTPPYIDPPSGGAWGQWADSKPWYFDEETPPEPHPPGYEPRYHWENPYNNRDTDGDGTLDTFWYEDFPYGPVGTDLEFYTWLVSCNADGSLHSFHGGFNWTWKRGSVLCDIAGPLPDSLAYQYYYATIIPEPASVILASLGIACLVIVSMVRRRHAG